MKYTSTVVKIFTTKTAISPTEKQKLARPENEIKCKQI